MAGRAAGQRYFFPSSTPLAADFGPGPEAAVKGQTSWARSSLFCLSLTGLSTRGPAMLSHFSLNHLRLYTRPSPPDGVGKAGAFTV